MLEKINEASTEVFHAETPDKQTRDPNPTGEGTSAATSTSASLQGTPQEPRGSTLLGTSQMLPQDSAHTSQQAAVWGPGLT